MEFCEEDPHHQLGIFCGSRSCVSDQHVDEEGLLSQHCTLPYT